MKIKKALIGQGGVYDGATAVAGNRVYGPVNRPPGKVEPLHHGIVGWTYDPALSGAAGSIPTGGVLNLARIYTDIALSITTVNLYITAAGATLGNVGVGLWNLGTAGAIIGSSVNANGATAVAFQSPGSKLITFTAGALAIPVGGCYIGWWTTGTTQPTFMRSSTLGGINVGLAINSSRFATANTALTTIAPTTLGAISAASVAWWGGVL